MPDSTALRFLVEGRGKVHACLICRACNPGFRRCGPSAAGKYSSREERYHVASTPPVFGV